MKKKITSILGATAIALVLGIVIFQNLVYRSAIDSTLKWARLAPFPVSRQDFHLEVKGGMFSREFVVDFKAPAPEIAAWLQASPGTREAVVTMPSPHTRHFAVTPGGGAQFAEVTVDDTNQRVLIRVYWS